MQKKEKTSASKISNLLEEFSMNDITQLFFQYTGYGSQQEKVYNHKNCDFRSYLLHAKQQQVSYIQNYNEKKPGTSAYMNKELENDWVYEQPEDYHNSASLQVKNSFVAYLSALSKSHRIIRDRHKKNKLDIQYIITKKRQQYIRAVLKKEKAYAKRDIKQPNMHILNSSLWIDYPIKENEVVEQNDNKFKKVIDRLQGSVKILTKENILIKELLYSKAVSFGDSKTTQLLPINIYLDTNDNKDIFEVYDAILKFTKNIGFEVGVEFEAVKGSWIKRMIATSKKKLSSEDVLDRIKEAEYGIEVNTILKQQSEIDKNASEALVNIITSLKDIPNAAIRIGALIVVKVTDNEGAVSLQTRTLSIKELHLLNKKPELLQMPKQILQSLAKEIKDDELPQISEN